MPSIQNWIDEAQETAIFKGGGGGMPGIAGKPLLEISPTNRIVNVNFARLAIAVRLVNNCLGVGYDSLGKLVDMAEEYQLTIGDTKNSRDAFLESIKAQFSHYVRGDGEKGKRGLLGV